MREIKIRVWDGSKYIEPDYMDSYGCVYKYEKYDEPSIIEECSAEVFTGLIDQKNNQWCEGDILGALEPDDGSKCIIMRDEVGFYRQGIRTDYQIRLEKQDVDYWIKIGTMYENPELLNA